MKIISLSLAAALSLYVLTPQAGAQNNRKQDEFFWLGEINKATAVINTEEGLLDKSMAPLVYKGITQVLADGDKPGGKRPTLVITFEPLLIEAPARRSHCCTPAAPARTCWRQCVRPSCAMKC